MMTQDFKGDFFEIMRMIVEADSMAFARAADGEANVLKNNTIGNKDGWLYKQDKNLIFRADLRRSMFCSDHGFIYGISCTCCDRVNHEYLLKLLKTDRSHMTFSNMWVNANFPLFMEHFFKTLKSSGKDIIICTNAKAKIKNIETYFPVKAFMPIPGNCVTYWEEKRDYTRALLDLHGSTRESSIFLFAAGPLSQILIHELWQINPRHIMLDIGSSMDPILFNRKSRDYHNISSNFSQRVCTW
jgi:hypothetical protein